MSDLLLILSLVNLGFFGGFSHCIGMCGPFVLTQVSNRLQILPLENFSGLQRLKNLALLPYHAGRISTYCFVGFCCSFLTNNIQNFLGFKIFSAIFLLGAAIIFLNIFFEGKISTSFLNKKIRQKIEKIFKQIYLPFKSKNLESAAHFFTKKISVLFRSPQGFRGYFLGIILGFIPCGLLYAAFLIAGTIANPFLAAIGMISFGIATFPSLFLTSLGGHIFTKIPEFKFIAKALILLNVIMLVLLAVKLI